MVRNHIRWNYQMSVHIHVLNPIAEAFVKPVKDIELIHPKENRGILMTSSNGNISALLALCAGNSQVTGEFPVQRPVTRSFDVFVALRLNKRLSKQSCGWWFETPSPSSWRHCNGYYWLFQIKYVNDKSHEHWCFSIWWRGPGRRSNINVTSCQYRKPYFWDLKTVLSPQWDFLYW